MSLNSETVKVAMVVDVPYGLTVEQTEEKLKKFISLYCVNWFYIYHDKDKDEQGKEKTKHFHLLFQSGDGKKHRLLYYINLMRETFETESNDPYSARIWKNYESDIQYLVHKNNPEKYQYPLEDVHSFDDNEFKNIYEVTVTQSITIERIQRVCKESKTLTECYLKLGLGTSQMYRGLIKDIFLDIVYDNQQRAIHGKEIL